MYPTLVDCYDINVIPNWEYFRKDKQDCRLIGLQEESNVKSFPGIIYCLCESYRQNVEKECEEYRVSQCA